MASAGGKVLLILFPGAVAYELATAAEVLSRGRTVEVATPDGGDHRDGSGLVYRADTSFRAAAAADYAAIVVAGGDLGSILDDEDLFSLLRAATRHGAILAAICAGPLALAKAGVLHGHDYTQAGLYPASIASVWDGATFHRAPVVESGQVLTALPEAHIDFAVALAVKLGVLADGREAEARRAYLKGQHERDWSKIGAVDDP